MNAADSVNVVLIHRAFTTDVSVDENTGDVTFSLIDSLKCMLDGMNANNNGAVTFCRYNSANNTGTMNRNDYHNILSVLAGYVKAEEQSRKGVPSVVSVTRVD